MSVRRIVENKVNLDVKVPNLRDKSEKHIILTVTDEDNNLLNLLKAIQSTANIGHTFDVVIDPGDSEFEQSFVIDGDGIDHILDITINEYKGE